MTTEQAIAIIQEYLYRHRYGYISKNKEFDSLYNAMQVVIQALQTQADRDLISRQAVQDYIAKFLSQYLYNDVREAVETIDEYIGELPTVAIPSAEPCEDAISRQAVLDLLEDTNNGWIINEVSRLPSVKPQEPTDENLHREREQAYMQGYEDASKRFRKEPCEE